MTETEIQRDVLAALRLYYPNGLWIRVQSGRVKVRGGHMQLAPKGTPDLLGSLPVRRKRQRESSHWAYTVTDFPVSMVPVAVEVKRPGQEPTDAQAEKLERYRAANAPAVVVHSAAEAVALVIAELDRLGLEAA